MTYLNQQVAHRRALLKFIAGSPLWASGLASCIPEARSEGSFARPLQDRLISSPEEAVNVFDFRAVAQDKLPPAHYGYMATGVLDNRTLLENEKAFQRIQLRMRRLMDMSKVDTSVELFGETYQSPIMICPCGSQKAFHPEGEIATARAAREEGHLQMLSTVATSSVEEVTEARGAPIWYQLYPPQNWDDVLGIVHRAEGAGCPVLVITVDMDYADKREALTKMMALDERMCKTCHGQRTPADHARRKPMINDLEKQFKYNRAITWDLVDQIRKETKMKVVIKGIVADQDAALAVDYGVDGIIVSNHGGRATDNGRASIDCLPEVVEAVNGQIPVMLDSGIRRGGDIFKALAMGATAVGIGRPYLWGLGAFGQPGVEMVLRILKEEFKLVMQQTGVRSIKEINSSHLA